MLDRSLSAALETPIFGRSDGIACGWAVSRGPVDYPAALAAMEGRAAGIAGGRAVLGLRTPPPLYTAGVSAKPGDLLDAERFPVFATGRGGQFTYHGPG